jgi:hypothetical protein
LREFETLPSPKSQDQELDPSRDPRNSTGEFAAGLTAFTENAADGSGAFSGPPAARSDSATTERALKRLVIGVIVLCNLSLEQPREREFRNS